ncbi:TniQ family protein [Tateyamaria omphalii]|uniref:TniQ domain-containing protein n=1 Tax=Tateyamaria omphalii TaxID=299262 RepID=A0A1P8MQL3_9RHOB|nr:TniQ family protein [Tateyamaria omphalii]APX10283.1 hypothetical protein BWR18_00135 [Tateyamaria omphalii]
MLFNPATSRHRETLISLFSRSASMHGLPFTVFANEMGLGVRSIVNAEDRAVRRIQELHGLSEDAVRELVSWSGKPIGKVRIHFRGAEVVSRALRNPTIRGCLTCLKEDAALTPKSPANSMALRGDWHLRHVAICLRHSKPLEPLWTEGPLSTRYDLTTQMQRLNERLATGDLTKEKVAITEYDRWLDNRLETGEDPTWLRQTSLANAAAFVRLLSSELLRLEDHAPLADDKVLEGRSFGFDAVKHDEDAASKALVHLVELANGHLDEPQKAFGKLYSWLARDTLEDPDCDLFRNIMREVILDRWAVAPGDIVLGKAISQRRVHSVTTAASSVDLGTRLTRRLLSAKGLIEVDDPRPCSRLTFDAQSAVPVLAKISRLVGPIEMRRRMNTTRKQFDALVEGGLLTRFDEAEPLKSPWDPEEGLSLIAELTSDAEEVSIDETEWEHIYQAALRARVPIEQIVAAIRKGKIRTGHCPDLSGYASVFVRKSDIDAAVRPERPSDPTVAEFARMVGLHRDGGMRALVKCGATPSTPKFNPQTATVIEYITEADALEFHGKFTTLKLLANRMGQPSRTLSARLRKAGISQFRSDGIACGSVFLKNDLDRYVEFSRDNPDLEALQTK